MAADYGFFNDSWEAFIESVRILCQCFFDPSKDAPPIIRRSTNDILTFFKVITKILPLIEHRLIRHLSNSSTSADRQTIFDSSRYIPCISRQTAINGAAHDLYCFIQSIASGSGRSNRKPIGRVTDWRKLFNGKVQIVKNLLTPIFFFKGVEACCRCSTSVDPRSSGK